VPTNSKDDRIGFAVHMLWSMHHNLAMIYPKIGELVAFRDIGTRLALDQQSDEDLIRMNLEKAGYRCAYAPDAIVYNRGPETEEDFLKQRTRVNIGECNMKKKYDYDIPSWNRKYVLKALFGTVRDLGFHPLKMLYVGRLEMKARSDAKKYIENGNCDMNIWDPVGTTKKLRSDFPAVIPCLARAHRVPVGEHRIPDGRAGAYPASPADYAVFYGRAFYPASAEDHNAPETGPYDFGSAHYHGRIDVGIPCKRAFPHEHRARRGSARYARQ
jgi:hypothetical protein